jgi:hypothetical protein
MSAMISRPCDGAGESAQMYYATRATGFHGSNGIFARLSEFHPRGLAQTNELHVSLQVR